MPHVEMWFNMPYMAVVCLRYTFGLAVVYVYVDLLAPLVIVPLFCLGRSDQLNLFCFVF